MAKDDNATSLPVAAPDGFVSKDAALFIAKRAATWGASHHAWSDKNIILGCDEWFECWKDSADAEHSDAAPQAGEKG